MSDVSEVFGNITKGFLTAGNGVRLAGMIETNTATTIENALVDNADVQRWRRENGQCKAEILEVRITIVDEKKAFAEYQQQVQVQFKENIAAIDTKAPPVFDHTSSGCVIYRVKAGINRDGTDTDAGIDDSDHR